MSDAPGQTRAGFVALIGASNVGKSTLVNKLTGAKVAIVSHKVQTTRTTIRGIAIEGDVQIIFVDTPGIFAPKRRLDRAMVQRAWSGASDADVIALMVDAKRGIDADTDSILGKMAAERRAGVLIINKVDLVRRDSLLELAANLNERIAFTETFMVSAETGDGVAQLRTRLGAMMPFGPWLYPEDQVSDAPLRALAAEITREKIFERLHEELPYASTVETTQWKELKGGGARIEQTIFVERQSQRKIVLGKNGQTIKAIGSEARRELSQIIDAPVHLFLFVKVREGWGNDPERFREMGLDFTD